MVPVIAFVATAVGRMKILLVRRDDGWWLPQISHENGLAELAREVYLSRPQLVPSPGVAGASGAVFLNCASDEVFTTPFSTLRGARFASAEEASHLLSDGQEALVQQVMRVAERLLSACPTA